MGYLMLGLGLLLCLLCAGVWYWVEKVPDSEPPPDGPRPVWREHAFAQYLKVAQDHIPEPPAEAVQPREPVSSDPEQIPGDRKAEIRAAHAEGANLNELAQRFGHTRGELQLILKLGAKKR
ncbi:MAG TPA: DUF2802 domain-containing protein [Firmicutes bacterium]|jgi:hypothetical protein|nr:DUF2802 domain-containing protein [Bacillota bacterium]